MTTATIKENCGRYQHSWQEFTPRLYYTAKRQYHQSSGGNCHAAHRVIIEEHPSRGMPVLLVIFIIMDANGFHIPLLYNEDIKDSQLYSIVTHRKHPHKGQSICQCLFCLCVPRCCRNTRVATEESIERSQGHPGSNEGKVIWKKALNNTTCSLSRQC